MHCTDPACKGRLRIVHTNLDTDVNSRIRRYRCPDCSKIYVTLERVIQDDEKFIITWRDSRMVLRSTAKTLLRDRFTLRADHARVCYTCSKALAPQNKSGYCTECYRTSELYRSLNRERWRRQKRAQRERKPFRNNYVPCLHCALAHKGACTLDLPEAFTREAQYCAAFKDTSQLPSEKLSRETRGNPSRNPPSAV